MISAKFICLCMKTPNSLSSEEKKSIKASYEQYSQELVYKDAKELKILPYVAHALIDCDCDKEFWEKIHEEYRLRNERVLALLQSVFLALNENGINKVCVAENFGSILSSDACIACFSSGDIDLYCDDIEIKKLDGVMKSLGFEWDDRHERKKSFAHEYRSDTAIGETWWLNFQWKPMTRKKTHLYDQRYVMRRYHTLFDETEYYKDTNIRIFKPEAALYLNCVHISSGHYYILPPGIRLYPDVDRPVLSRNIDWEKFREWIEEDRLGMRSDIVLHLCKTQLGTNIPEEAFTSMYRSKRFNKVLRFLIDEETLEYQYKRGKGYYSNFPFLIKTELRSDGTNVFIALWRRVVVLVTDHS